ncbi:uncharacterized protein LOC135201976 [Macrobrachium nipponense]|uniref:uncharacterized protein LOC135201976 n=1 Tax=Macrobrachium nipponense TaxID=159736 RepID=UPI0030C87214
MDRSLSSIPSLSFWKRGVVNYDNDDDDDDDDGDDEEEEVEEDKVEEEEEEEEEEASDRILSDHMPPVLSVREKEKFVDNGTTYVFDKVSKDGETQFWRCDQRSSCKAHIHVHQGRITKRIGAHAHLGDAANAEVMTALTDLRNRAVVEAWHRSVHWVKFGLRLGNSLEDLLDRKNLEH